MENTSDPPSDRIEYANRGCRFTEAEMRGFVEETKQRQAQPGYAEKEARETRAAEARAKTRGIKFPELAARGTTKPALAATLPAPTPRANGWRRMFEMLS